MGVVKQTRILSSVSDVLQLRLVCGLEPNGDPCGGNVLWNTSPSLPGS